MFEDYVVYKVWHKKEGRFYAILVSPKHRTTMSWARYKMSISLNRKLEENEEVDHIDGCRTNDNIDNLQILCHADNVKKSSNGVDLVTLICPNCNKEFVRERRKTHLIKGGMRTFCSRRCNGQYNYRGRL